MALRELIDFLVEVENDGDGDDDGYQKDVSGEELLDDISVDAVDVQQSYQRLEAKHQHTYQSLSQLLANGCNKL